MVNLHNYSGLRSGWTRLANGFDVEFIHGIPSVVSDNGQPGITDDAQLVDEVSGMSGLRTTLLGWYSGEAEDEHETQLCIDAMQFEDVLQRLAKSSAALFVERYHKPINEMAVDWDKQAYDVDFSRAIRHCCLNPEDINKADYFARYKKAMHKEAQCLVQAGVQPMLEAE